MTLHVARQLVDVVYVIGAATGLFLGGSVHVALGVVLLAVVGGRRAARRA